MVEDYGYVKNAGDIYMGKRKYNKEEMQNVTAAFIFSVAIGLSVLFKLSFFFAMEFNEATMLLMIFSLAISICVTTFSNNAIFKFLNKGKLL